jgi:hypothetical protein
MCAGWRTATGVRVVRALLASMSACSSAGVYHGSAGGNALAACEPGAETATVRAASATAAAVFARRFISYSFRSGVSAHREPEADARDRGVDPDDASTPVGERAAPVAGVQRRVGLDHVVDDAHVRAGARRQRVAERGDDARRDRAREPVRVPDRDDELPDSQPLDVPELGGRERVAAEAKYGEVGERVDSDDGELDVAPVGEGRTAGAGGSRDDVGGGDEESVGCDHAAVEHAPAAHAPRDASSGSFSSAGGPLPMEVNRAMQATVAAAM